MPLRPIVFVALALLSCLPAVAVAQTADAKAQGPVIVTAGEGVVTLTPDRAWVSIAIPFVVLVITQWFLQFIGAMGGVVSGNFDFSGGIFRSASSWRTSSARLPAGPVTERSRMTCCGIRPRRSSRKSWVSAAIHAAMSGKGCVTGASSIRAAEAPIHAGATGTATTALTV